MPKPEQATALLRPLPATKARAQPLTGPFQSVLSVTSSGPHLTPSPHQPLWATPITWRRPVIGCNVAVSLMELQSVVQHVNWNTFLSHWETLQRPPLPCREILALLAPASLHSMLLPGQFTGYYLGPFLITPLPPHQLP